VRPNSTNCHQVTGSGTESPEGVVGTSLYTANEDGIIFNPYAATIDYKIPGPALWPSGSGSGSSPAPSTPSNGTSTATPTAPAATSAAASSAAASAPAATSAVAEATPTASATPAPSSGAELPKTFTLETFIAWLEEAAASSNTKARRHARALF
jgi:cellulase